jgi:ABC-2 type transport system ATP-binding protein
MDGLLSRGEMHPSYEFTLAEDREDLEQQLRRLPGVLDVARRDGRPVYAITFDAEQTDTNRLLSGVIDLGATIVAFSEQRKHLNQAFMDLTEAGVR